MSKHALVYNIIDAATACENRDKSHDVQSKSHLIVYTIHGILFIFRHFADTSLRLKCFSIININSMSCTQGKIYMNVHNPLAYIG